MRHIHQQVKLLIGLIEITNLQTRIDDLYLKSDPKIVALIAILLHKYHSLLNISLMILHKMLQPKLLGQIQHQQNLLLVIIVICYANTLIIFTNLVQKVQIVLLLVVLVILLHLLQ